MIFHLQFINVIFTNIQQGEITPTWFLKRYTTLNIIFTNLSALNSKTSLNLCLLDFILLSIAMVRYLKPMVVSQIYWFTCVFLPLKRSLTRRKEMTSRKTVWLSNFRWREDRSTGIRHSRALISVRSLSLYLLDLKLKINDKNKHKSNFE